MSAISAGQSFDVGTEILALGVVDKVLSTRRLAKVLLARVVDRDDTES